MVLLDTNIFIYISQGKLPADIAPNEDIAHATITEIEALGYRLLPVHEMRILGELFAHSQTLELTSPVVQTAIALRQRHPLSLGDAIIAATALEHGLTLWTANTADFRRIEDLDVVDPHVLL